MDIELLCDIIEDRDRIVSDFINLFKVSPNEDRTKKRTTSEGKLDRTVDEINQEYRTTRTIRDEDYED